MPVIYDTFPVITQTVPEINKTVATPRVAKLTVALSESVPAMYAVVIVQVIVIAPVVLLNMETASPSVNVASGIVIDPPEPTCTYSPTSVVASVYEPVFVPTGGIFLYPKDDVISGRVKVMSEAKAAGTGRPVEEADGQRGIAAVWLQDG
jgi:hypothetical protein